jgi:ubiquinone biosynthesis monooxygenase Coq7
MAAIAEPLNDIDLGSRILKVSHAGEHGAINIYSGQIIMARFTARAMVDELKEFREHEQRHRAIFGAELQRRGRRRCRSYWLCGIGGFVLGILTTVAVERVVLRHLEHQVAVLSNRDPAAVAAIEAIIQDEKLHHDQSASHVHADGLWYKLLSPVVAASTEAVIWSGMRL